MEAAGGGALEKLRQERTLRIAVRDAAPPFSFKDEKGEPAGFMVELCRSVSKDLAAQLNLGDLNIEYVPLTAANPFETIEAGTADLLCESTSVTLSRLQRDDFAIATFMHGA